MACILLTVVIAEAPAQIFNSTFGYNTAAGFSLLTGGTIIQSGSAMNTDQNILALPIGFTFTFNAINYTTFNLNNNGYIYFGILDPAPGEYFPISSSSGMAGVIAGWACNISANNPVASTLRYQTTGVAPNRVLTVEWFNIKGDASADQMDFQIMLFETSNKAEIHYHDDIYLLSGYQQVQVGIRGSNNTDFHNRSMTCSPGSSWSATANGVSNTATCYVDGRTAGGCNSPGTAFPAANATFVFTQGPGCGTHYSGTATPSPATICTGQASVISLSGYTVNAGINFQWQLASASGGPYSNISGAASASYSTPALSATTYYRCVVSCPSNGLTGNSTVAAVTVNPYPVVSVSPSAPSICNGSSVSLTASGATTYSWTPSTGLNTTSGATVIANPTVTTTYTVTGTNPPNCTATANATVTVNPGAVSITPPSATIVQGNSVSLTASGAGIVSWSWSPATGLNTTSGATVNASPSSTITYTVTGTDGGGCTRTQTVLVTVTPASGSGGGISCAYSFSGITGTAGTANFPTIVGTAGTTLIASGSGIDDNNYPNQSFPSGFAFDFNGILYSSFGINSNGFIWLGSGTPAAASYSPLSNASANLNGSGIINGIISAWGADLYAHPYASDNPYPQQINVNVSGSAPNRIVTVEWTAFVIKGIPNSSACFNTYGFYDDHRQDFQIKLYENGGTNGNRIEIAYRDQYNYCIDSQRSGQIGLRGASNADFFNRKKAGNSHLTAASTSAGTLNSDLVVMNGTRWINGNITFRFTPTISTPIITASGTTTFCNGGSVTLSTSVTGVTYQWFQNGSSIAGATSSNYAATQSGNYTVMVTNAASCTRTSAPLTVTVNAPPVITSCPANVTVNNTSGQCGAVVTYPAATASGSPAPSITYSQNSGTFFTAGITTVTVTATNICGSASCNFNVNVNDNENPVITCPSDVTASPDPGQCYASNVALGSASVNDNCPGASAANDAPANFPAGTTSVTWTATDASGNTATCTQNVTVTACASTLDLKFFIEGYYAGNGSMTSALYNQGVEGATATDVDTVTIELHNSSSPYAVAASFTGILQTDGSISCTYPGSVTGNSYFIAIRHRSALQTWSASPVTFSTVTNYDFSTSSAQAYGSMTDTFSEGIWVLYNGDINQDDAVDMLDFPDLENDINSAVFGHFVTDLNGDGNVDLLDFPVLEANMNNGLFSSYP